MILNILFLAGGIGVGYLLRGELDRRKSKKAWGTALEEGIKVAEKWLGELTNKKDEEPEDDSVDELWSVLDQNSNSSDETIQL